MLARPLKATEREKQIAEMLGAGLNHAEAGKALKIAKRTVKFYATKIRNKRNIVRKTSIVLAVQNHYAMHPEDVPFSDGDRAAQLGHKSAAECVTIKLMVERDTMKSLASRIKNGKAQVIKNIPRV